MMRFIVIAAALVSMLGSSPAFSCGADNGNGNANGQQANGQGANRQANGRNQAGQQGQQKKAAAAKPVNDAGAKKTLASESLALAGGPLAR